MVELSNDLWEPMSVATEALWFDLTFEYSDLPASGFTMGYVKDANKATALVMEERHDKI
jgi:hypothetical protein